MSSQKKLGIIGSAFIFFIVLYYLTSLTPLQKILSLTRDPIESGVVSISHEVNKALSAQKKSKYELVKDISALEKKIQDLTVEILELQSLKQENAQLRDMLEFKKETNFIFISADVTAKTNTEVGRTLTINKGTNNGAYVGAPVVVGKGVFAGKVVSVGPYSALVRLTTDRQSNILATLDRVLQGTTGSGIMLSFIPKNTPLSPGQRVVTNGLQEHIPANLYLGDVIELQESEETIFNTALVKVPYSIDELTSVAIITRVNVDE